jgi:hypothetical protein
MLIEGTCLKNFSSLSFLYTVRGLARLNISLASALHNYMVITDQLTKSVILIRIDIIIIENMVEVFLIYFYMHYGLPLAITSNHGP